MECLLKESVRVTRPRIRAFPLAAAIHLAAALLYLVASAPVHAQSTPAPNSREAREAEQRAAWQAAAAVATHGPADITLLDQAVLRLPARQVFVPKAEAVRILRALGNTVS